MIIIDDVLNWSKKYTGENFHAILCDPPYELGFMGKDWDKSGIAFNPETWRSLAEHLHPGGFLMAFASSRGWHRLAVAIEDAGFVIHPTIFGWSFGSGFPKATRIDTQVDKAAGAEQRIVGKSARQSPRHSLARAWAGHRYGLQALKPAVEPIIVAQKPYKGKPIESITKTGAGALNVDGGRIAGQYETRDRATDGGNSIFGTGAGGGAFVPALGRWPANLILHHRPECNGKCVEGCAVAALDMQSGVLHSPGNYKRGMETRNNIYNTGMGHQKVGAEKLEYDSGGGASRFFYNVAAQLDEADPIRYCAKASRRERDAGCDWLDARGKIEVYGDGMSSPTRLALGHTEEGRAARASHHVRNHHPTVKPIALARYLATLLLPPAEYAPRRLLVPFAGVGSEIIGAIQAGWENVVGIEKNSEYVEIGEKRIEFYSKKSQPTQQLCFMDKSAV